MGCGEYEGSLYRGVFNWVVFQKEGLVKKYVNTEMWETLSFKFQKEKKLRVFSHLPCSFELNPGVFTPLV